MPMRRADGRPAPKAIAISPWQPHRAAEAPAWSEQDHEQDSQMHPEMRERIQCRMG